MSKSTLIQIEELEQRIQDIIESCGTGSQTLANYEKQAVKAIISILDDYTAEELASIDLKAIISEVLKKPDAKLSVGLVNEISSNVKALVDDTLQFYKEQGEEVDGIYDAVRRSQDWAQTKDAFNTGMKTVNKTLKATTFTVFDEAIRLGRIDREEITKKIQAAAVTHRTFAEVQTQVVISGYNQIARNEIRDKAQLDYGYYSGPNRTGRIRLFCQYHVGKVFLYTDILKMRNGSFEPVTVNKGGYRCIHSILYGRKAWYVGKEIIEPGVATAMDAEGKRRIVVILAA